LTGQGETNPSVRDGFVPPEGVLAVPRSAVSATIGGRSAEILFAGLTPQFVGLLQVNLKVPSLPSGDYPLVVTIGGVASNSALIAVSGN